MKSLKNKISESIASYTARTGTAPQRPGAVLFDMDGVLYNSMPFHARSWNLLFSEIGIDMPEQEVYLHEGRTGASTVTAIFERELHRQPTEDEIRQLYRRKTELFAGMGAVKVMTGARETVNICRRAGATTVIVTGSGQGTLLDRLDSDFDCAFPAPSQRITAYDVTHGKPDPEPYLKGIAKAGTSPWQSVGIDNAPLGVESSSRAGLFTIGVNTGPLPSGTLKVAGADLELDSMEECAEALGILLL